MFKGLKILIVDDIFINRMLLVEISEKLGLEYEEAKNGKEAVDLLKTEDFDVILMDIEMPVMNGFETTKYIRTQFDKPKSETPIIAITAHAISKFKTEFKEVGFTCILGKPYRIDKFQKVLSDLFI